MKLSDIKGEQALDILADLIDPVSEIAQDEKVVALIRTGKRLDAVKVLLKDHKKTVMEILAYLNGEGPKTYSPSLLSLPVMVLNILNDPELADLFTPGDEVTSSGSHTESTEAEEN